MYELLDPDTKVQRFDSTFFLSCAIKHPLSVREVVLCVSLELRHLDAARQYYTGKSIAVRGFGGWLAGLEARLTKARRRQGKRYSTANGQVL